MLKWWEESLCFVLFVPMKPEDCVCMCVWYQNTNPLENLLVWFYITCVRLDLIANTKQTKVYSNQLYTIDGLLDKRQHRNGIKIQTTAKLFLFSFSYSYFLLNLNSQMLQREVQQMWKKTRYTYATEVQKCTLWCFWLENEPRSTSICEIKTRVALWIFFIFGRRKDSYKINWKRQH